MRAVPWIVCVPLSLAVMAPGAAADAAASDPALAPRIEALGEQALVNPGPAAAAMRALQRTLDPDRDALALRRLGELRCWHEPVTRDGVAAARQLLDALPPLRADAPVALREQHQRLRLCERVLSAYGARAEEVALVERDLDRLAQEAAAAGLPRVSALARA